MVRAWKKKTPVETMAKNGCLHWAEVKDGFFVSSIHGATHASISFQPERRTPMKEQNTYVEYSRSEIDTQSDETKWNRFDALTDADIDTAAASDEDDPKTDATFWEDATVVMPENIVAIDLDLLEWFKTQALDYETQINTVLREYVEANADS